MVIFSQVLYANAFAERDHTAARRLERWRSVSPRSTGTAGSGGVAPARPSLHGPRAPWPHPANLCARQRGIRSTDRLEERALAKPRALFCSFGAVDATYTGRFCAREAVPEAWRRRATGFTP